MPTTIRILKVFLASPSDVKSERLAAHDIVTAMNKLLAARFGWNIELYMWEDAPPGYGRPQEIINPAVDDCDLFVGLLWEHWGQPTGKYSSGFEEEYERALDRRKTGEAPEIWLFFKMPNPEKVKDPGAELTRVIEFQKAQGAAREVLFKEVADSAEWGTNLQNWLWDHVAKRALPPALASKPQQPKSASDHDSVEIYTEGAGTSQQLIETAAALTRTVKSGDLEFARSQANLLKEFDIARLFLLSATWMSRRYTDETLGTHEINLLYKHRERLDATGMEHLHLLRSIVADNSAVAPGWFWFSFATPDSLRDELLGLANNDSSSNVRRRALQYLREAKVTLPDGIWQLLPLLDGDEAVKSEAFKYLSSFADENILTALEQNAIADGDDITTRNRETRLSILVRLNPRKSFAELIETGQHISDGMIKKLGRHAAELDDATLEKGADSQWEHVRRFSVKELARRGHLGKAFIEKLTNDSSIEIRGIAFTELARRGSLDLSAVRKSLAEEGESKSGALSLTALMSKSEPEDKADADSVVLTYFRHQSAKNVLDAVDWFRTDGVLAYESLTTDHCDAIRQDLGPDIESGFERVRRRSIEGLESKFGASEAGKIVKGFEDLEDFIRSQFVKAALVGMVINGEPSDARFGRRYLASERSDIKLAAVKIVSKFGNADDVPSLLQISKEGWGEARDEAGAAALRLSPKPIDIALELAESNSPELVIAAYAWLYNQNSFQVEDFFKRSMESENDTKRVRALYYFSKNRHPEDLEIMLQTELNKETYYYNVVTWLDRLLYAPEPLRVFFIKDLERQATD